MTATADRPYIVIGGFILNTFVSANQLARVYGLPPEKCVLASSEAMIRGMRTEGKIILRPRADGNYTLGDFNG